MQGCPGRGPQEWVRFYPSPCLALLALGCPSWTQCCPLGGSHRGWGPGREGRSAGPSLVPDGSEPLALALPPHVSPRGTVTAHRGCTPASSLAQVSGCAVAPGPEPASCFSALVLMLPSWASVAWVPQEALGPRVLSCLCSRGALVPSQAAPWPHCAILAALGFGVCSLPPYSQVPMEVMAGLLLLMDHSPWDSEAQSNSQDLRVQV